MKNTQQFLAAALASLTAAGVTTWLFGGWAEELWAISAPREHHDIDLLYLAEDFDHLQSFLDDTPSMTEIALKRFLHKRAVLCDNVMVEFLLVQQDKRGLFTRFFDGRRVFYWPNDTLSYTVQLEGSIINIASQQALAEYRRYHPEIELSYQDFLRGR